MENAQELISTLQEIIAVYGIKLLAAVAIFIIGRIISRWVKSLVSKILTKGKNDPIIINFVSNIAYVGMMAFVVLASLGQLGIETTSFIAILGAAGLAIGLALQGSLSNFAAGFLMVMFRPFKIGDFIEGAGVSGSVIAIHMFTTTLKTGDNKIIIIPNAKLGEDNIINYSQQDTRRVETTVGVSYNSNLAQVRSVIKQIIDADDRIMQEPEPLIAVSELADSSVNFLVRVWVKSTDYWGVTFDLNEQVKLQFDEEGIELPFPQRDVHIFEQSVSS